MSVPPSPQPSLHRSSHRSTIDLRPRARALGRSVSLWVALIYLLVAVLYLVAPPIEPALPLALTAVGCGLGMALLWRVIPRVPDGLVYPVTAAAALAGVCFALSFVAITGDPAQSVVVVISMLAAACFLIHLPSLLLVVAVALGGWALTSQELTAAQQLHWGINLVVASALAVLVCWARARTLAQLEVEKRETERAREALAVQAAELARARDAAFASVRAKSEFLANMSHELRTPLGGILGLADLVLDGELDREQRDNIETLRLSGEGLLSIIDDVLDFTRYEAGRVRAEVEPMRVRDVLDACVDRSRARAARKGLRLSLLVDPAVPVSVEGAPLLLGRAIASLLDNAIKFTERGVIDVEVSALGSGRLRFDVRDTGIGIAPADRERIWEAFVQADGTASRRFEGTGLGLAICRGLVELMGGTIAVESEPGRGSTFSLELPMPASAHLSRSARSA